jgi:hypothetical protein
MNKLLIILFFIGTIIMLYMMSTSGKPITTDKTPLGILQLEFAYNKGHVNKILDAWKPSATQTEDKIAAARHNTWLDFIFIFCYAGLIYLLCRKLSGIYRDGTSFETAGKKLALAGLLAGCFDMIENICMFQSLSNNVQGWIAAVTTICATIKFCLVLVALGYIFISAPLAIYAKIRE